MSLLLASTHIQQQLAAVLRQLTATAYAQPLAILSGNSIGRHVRHVLEFYRQFIDSSRTGQLDYDQRPRNRRWEEDPLEALQQVEWISQQIAHLDVQMALQLQADPSPDGSGRILLPTSLARELLYNIEHAIHHMALIQIAIQTQFPHVVLPPHFGIAYSTIQYNAS